MINVRDLVEVKESRRIDILSKEFTVSLNIDRKFLITDFQLSKENINSVIANTAIQHGIEREAHRIKNKIYGDIVRDLSEIGFLARRSTGIELIEKVDKLLAKIKEA